MLSPKKQEAALLIAQGLTNVEIAKRLSKSERTVAEWKQQPAVHAEVKRIRQLWTRELDQYGLTQQSRRLQDLHTLYDLVWTVIRERGAEPSMKRIAGGATGIVVREPWKTETFSEEIPAVAADPDKKIAAQAARTVVHTRVRYRAKADLALVQELREIQKQIAIEMGQWTERREAKVSGVMKLEFSAEAIALAKTLTPEQLAAYRAELEKQEAAATP